MRHRAKRGDRMSMSTPQGGRRRPSVIKIGAKPSPKVEDDLESTATEPEASDDEVELENPPAKRTPRTAGTRTSPARMASAKDTASSTDADIRTTPTACALTG